VSPRIRWNAVRATSALAAFALLSGSVARAAGDKLIFAVAPGSKVLKRVNISHELRIDNMGKVLDDSPFVSDNTGGWITSTITISYLDEFRRTTENRPLEFVRTIREARNEVKATVTRSSGETQPESSGSRSPLRKQSVAFQWIEEERDWSRCYEKIEARCAASSSCSHSCPREKSSPAPRGPSIQWRRVRCSRRAATCR